MKKFLAVVTVLVMAFAFTACGGSGNFEWTRTGDFNDEAGHVLTIMEPQQEEGLPDGWYVGIFLDDEFHAWYVPQEGKTLHGNLTSEYDENQEPYVVTVSEEGEDGVKVEVEGGETYHFTPMAPFTGATMMINVDGIGEVTFAEEGEQIEFDDEYPMSSHLVNVPEPPEKYTIAARTTEEGYKFVKWTKDGEDFSTEPEVVVEVSEDVEYRAVFEHE